jgi:excinuclease ABC subunit B
MQYERNDTDLKRGRFRVRGETIELFPAYEKKAVRIQFFQDEVERIIEINPVSMETISELEKIALYPAKHFMLGPGRIQAALTSIKHELTQRTRELEKKSQGRIPARRKMGYVQIIK